MDNNNRNKPENGDGRKDQNNGKNNRGGQALMVYVLTSLVVLFFLTMLMNRYTAASTQEITYTEFLEMVAEDQVEAVEFDTYQINITPVNQSQGLYESQISYYCGYVSDDALLPILKEAGVEISRAIPDNTSTWLYNILSIILPLALLWMLMGFLMKRMGGGAMGVGKSKAKVFNMERTTGVTFKDVAGQDEAKESVQEIVDFLPVKQ